MVQLSTLLLCTVHCATQHGLAPPVCAVQTRCRSLVYDCTVHIYCICWTLLKYFVCCASMPSLPTKLTLLDGRMHAVRSKPCGLPGWLCSAASFTTSQVGTAPLLRPLVFAHPFAFWSTESRGELLTCEVLFPRHSDTVSFLCSVVAFCGLICSIV